MIKQCGRKIRIRRLTLLAAVGPVLAFLASARAEDASPAPILQYFESTYATLEARMSDVFKAGYGLVYTPPPGRADTGGSSVGYDQYNRFDLGGPNNPTLYGTEAGLKAAVAAAHRAGLDFGVDLVWNHNGYGGTGTAEQNSAFWAAGGYPGFIGPIAGSPDGDFHSSFANNDRDGRLAGLIDINHSSNLQFIRNPVNANDSRNLPAGTNVNKADPKNARFYTDTTGAAGVKYLFDPTTGEQNIPVYDFNLANPSAGVAVPENALGYLMRNAQWLVQAVGVDAFRLDATKNMEPFVLNYFDRAVYRASNRTLLDGSQKNVFAWGEAYDGDKGYLRTLIRKDINPADPGRIGGNRDTLDFPLFFALKANLSSNGFQNDWRNISGSSLDYADDGLMNGSIGVKFAGSHDDGLCDLSNVSYAYTLMTPGNTIIYDNAKQFGNGRDFPKGGRADALGGAYGDAITKLVGIRNVYAQGNFIPRLLSKESYAFERNKQSITLLSNRSDNYVDNQTLQTNFAAGTYLVELTGNGAKYGAPQVLQVQSAGGQSYVNVSIISNNGGDHGYLVYGLQAPQGSLAVGGTNQTIAGTPSPALTGTNDQKSYQNATTRLSDIRVITGSTFTATLNTNAVNLLGSIRDRDADGDNAVLKLDGGLDVNGNGHVDYTTPGGVVYGFEEFTGTKSTGYAAANGNGTYAQTINTAGLSEGYHYLTVRAFRHRGDGGPAVYSDFKETLYVDREKPVSGVDSFVPFGTSAGDNDVWVKSLDQTATNVRVFLNLPATVTDAQIRTMVANGQGTTDQLDRDIFKTGFFGIPKGNNTLTIVSTEITGNQNIQRLVGQSPTNARGAGLGDLDHNGTVDANDVAGTNYGFEHVLYTRNAEFNPSADVNADGLVDNRDLFALGTAVPATNSAAQTAIRQAVLRRTNINGQFGTDAYDIDAEYQRLGKTGDNWFEDLNVDGAVTQGDVDTLVRTVFGTEYGDTDLNGRVDFNDFLTLQNHFGQSGGWAFGDFTGNGQVDFNDFLALQNHFGYGGATMTASEVAALTSFARSVPEPSLLTAAMLALPILSRGRRRRPNPNNVPELRN